MNCSYFDTLKSLLTNSYCPYSNFQVSCILVSDNGQEYFGVNVENASYSLTICAERCALSNMVVNINKTDEIRVSEVHLLANSLVKKGERALFSTPTPCGACRQSLSEFAAENCLVYVYDLEGNRQSYNLWDLLPHSFKSTLTK